MPKKLQNNNLRRFNTYIEEVHRLDTCILPEFFVRGRGVRIHQGYSFNCSCCESSGIVWTPLTICPICGGRLHEDRA